MSSLKGTDPQYFDDHPGEHIRVRSVEPGEFDAPRHPASPVGDASEGCDRTERDAEGGPP